MAEIGGVKNGNWKLDPSTGYLGVVNGDEVNGILVNFCQIT